MTRQELEVLDLGVTLQLARLLALQRVAGRTQARRIVSLSVVQRFSCAAGRPGHERNRVSNLSGSPPV